MRTWALAAVGALLTAGVGRGQVMVRQAAALPPVAMPDQFEQTHRLDDLKGRVVVLIYGDRKSADANKAVGAWLHVAFHPAAQGQPPAAARLAPLGTPGPDVVTVPIAVVGKVPGPVAALIRSQVRSGSPEVPVWLDFEDVMKGLFGLAPGVPNVIVVDTQGRLRYALAGSPTAEQLKQLAGAVEGLRQEAAPR